MLQSEAKSGKNGKNKNGKDEFSLPFLLIMKTIIYIFGVL